MVYLDNKLTVLKYLEFYCKLYYNEHGREDDYSINSKKF